MKGRDDTNSILKNEWLKDLQNSPELLNRNQDLISFSNKILIGKRILMNTV